MAENKKSFILYVDLISVVEKLIIKDRENKTNYAGELFYAILSYVNDKEVIDIDFIVELAFEPIKLSLKRDLKKFEITKNERSESAKIGNLKRWHNDLYILFKQGKKSLQECETEINNRKSSHSDNSDTVVKKEIANIADSVNESESVNESVNVILLEKETKERKFNFKNYLIDFGFEKNIVDDFLKNRKLKKLANTETACKNILKKIDSMPEDNNLVLKFAVEKGWGGFEKKWYYSEVEKNNTSSTEKNQGELSGSR